MMTFGCLLQNIKYFRRSKVGHKQASTVQAHYNMSLVMRNRDFCLSENKGADQLCSNCTADQRLCFHCMASTIPFLPKSEILNF